MTDYSAVRLQSPWRKDFPALTHLREHNQTYLDSAATSQKPQAMIDNLRDYYQQGAANVHRGQYWRADAVTAAFERSREQVAHWLGASAEQIVFTRGTTEALNLLAYQLESHVQPDDEIVISALEHHANLLPWQQLAQRRQARLVVLPLTAEGRLDEQAAHELITERTRILAISQLSNVLGVQLPIKALIQRAKSFGAWTIVDGAQGAVHLPETPESLGCDFYALSAHKLYGPEGIGALYGRAEAFEALTPWQFGGEMVEQAQYQKAQFRAMPMALEAGTPAIGPALGWAASLSYLQDQDLTAIAQHEHALLQQLLAGFARRPHIQLLAKPDHALASFIVSGCHSHDVSQLLSEQGVSLRSGRHCAHPLFQALGHPSALRVSLALYNDSDDLNHFFYALDNALELLK